VIETARFAPGIRFRCLGCHETIFGNVYVDLAGPAFRAYYHLDCILPEHDRPT